MTMVEEESHLFYGYDLYENPERWGRGFGQMSAFGHQGGRVPYDMVNAHDVRRHTSRLHELIKHQ